MAGFSLAALGINPTPLYHGQPGPAATQAYSRSSSAGTTARTKVGTVLVSNPSPVALAVRMGYVPSGTTSDGTHYWLGDVPIPANQSLVFQVDQYIRPADVIEVFSASLPAPLGVAAVASTTGGTLAAGTYYYKISATNAAGETLGSTEVSATTTGTTGSVVLSWTRSLGASGYKIYRGTAAGSENVLVATLTAGTSLTATDAGGTTTSTSPLTTATAGGCVFTISGVELPA